MRVDVDSDDADVELRRLAGGFDVDTIIRFEALLASQFQETQAIVHIDTGSLHNSGNMESQAHSRHRWEGSIRYGGLSPGGVHNPVRYAVFERNRGGAHDFMRPTRDIEDRYLDLVWEWVSDEAPRSRGRTRRRL